METTKTIQSLIAEIESTFVREDILSASRETLKNLILSLYDGLNKINGTYPDWWDRED